MGEGGHHQPSFRFPADIDADQNLAVNGVPVKERRPSWWTGRRGRGHGAERGKGFRVRPGVSRLAVSGALKDLTEELIAFWPVVPAEGFGGKLSLNFGATVNGMRRLSGVDYSGKSVLGYPGWRPGK